MWFLATITFPTHRCKSSWKEGDVNPQRDYGLHALISTSDHNRNLNLFTSFLVFQGFNNHVLHHLFPIIDKSKLYLLDDDIK